MPSSATVSPASSPNPLPAPSDAPGTPRVVAVSGGTGAVGARLLARLLDHPDVAEVRAVVRRAGQLPTHPKLKETVLDWNGPAAGEALKALLNGVDDAYCALGTTMKQAGSKPAFEMVDYHYVVEYARAAKAAGVRRFLMVSALGAAEKSMVFYSRVKGRAELAVTTLEFPVTVIAQPSLLLTSAERPDQRPGEAAFQKLAPVLNVLARGPLATYQAVPVDAVAGALVHAAFSGSAHGVVRLRAPFTA